MKTESASDNTIGTYDSRSIATAWVGTDTFEQTMQAMHKRSELAQEALDWDLVEQLEAEAQEMQDRLHQMVFNTYPVDDILEHIKDKLPGIMKQADVIAIISKWDDESLKQYESATKVDVTEMLIDALEPNEKQKKFALEIMNSEPVSTEEAGHDH
ncbi:hypothetical protein ACFLQV_04865 [Calditrichota bacterium]